MNNKRDEQFQGFAKLLFSGLYDQFNNLHYQEDDGEEKEAEKTKQGILDTIAEGVHDFAAHIRGHIYTQEVKQSSYEIPDMTEWPKEQA